MNFRSFENLLREIKKNQSGFTLVELLIYAVIFTIASGLLTGILVTISNVQTKENAAFEVTRQLQFVTQKIQYAVRDASIVDAVYEGSNPAAPCTTFCSVKLRVADHTLDPTIISSDANGVYITEGANPRQTITSSNVKITSLIFNKVGNPGGLSTVTMDIALVYNAPDPTLQIAKSLSSAIAHVSAATFDASILPSSAGTISIGDSTLTWKDITVSNGMTVAGAAGVGEFAGLTMQKSTTHGSTSINEYYVTSSPYDKYGQRYDVGGTPVLYLEGDINQSGRRAYFLNGNVGIGTTSPGHKLTVEGNGDSNTGVFAIDVTGSGGWKWASAAIAPSLAAGQNIIHMIGQAENAKNSGYIGFNYQGAGSNNNFVTFGLFSVDNIMNITGAGNVGIGTTSPGYKLDVTGDLRITGTPYRTGGDIAWAVPSDIRLKDVTGEFNYGLSDINKLNVVKFHYKEGNELGIPSEVEYGGLIAQEVQKVIPEAVSENKGYLTLNSTPIVWAMLNSIKELSAKVDTQQQVIDELNVRLNKLEGR